ncbi:unnamed protein product, partial [marine sediment metagenome]
MSEEKPKRMKGFAGIVWKLVEPLNSMEKFKEEFADVKVKILVNPKDQKRAALIKIDKGTIDIEDVKNDKETLKNLKYDGLFEAPFNLLAKVFEEGLSTGTLLKKWITRKIKLRGIRKLAIFGKLMA